MEILVHIAAPTALADDARYRAQAYAIAHAWELPDSHDADVIGPHRPTFDHSHSPLYDSPISVIPDSQPESSQDARRRLHPQPPSLVEQGSPGASSPSLLPNNSTLQDISSMLLPREIRPPPPPISTAPFATHITPTLAMLTRRLNPARTFKPSLQTRTLDQLERGYWSVRFTLHDPPDPPSPVDAAHLLNGPNPWESPSFHHFWSFLAEFVGKEARAGWGVWCILERDPSMPDPEMTDSPDAPGSVSVVLKVYAWGEVAMHVYLLLFLASERRVRGMGAEWRDFREEVVIRMP
ncbi:hypothetical protein N7492_001458 [Penicillium capsulatum]|uniref:Uncharacterized protein n=1 Tax=Penicillium capsulatum TaxID=69766 RepID=A0A9W9ITP9_9EURO|nr:hypothetical protein N7492_001458 [Penicillium capsulatum]KAJ6129488.1 hypothetical protein N7512_002268 [Penicillium capsulatum]